MITPFSNRTIWFHTTRLGLQGSTTPLKRTLRSGELYAIGATRCRGLSMRTIVRTTVRTAAALIIGDEILNGKTLDRNSHYFAQFCFRRGIDLKRIEVIPDDESEIGTASRQMVREYDLVITSGGIGPTHDDITYASLANAFSQKLVLHHETLQRMHDFNRRRSPRILPETPQQKAAAQRMAMFPEHSEVLFVDEATWVPVVRLEGKLCVLPGIPVLFQRLLEGLSDILTLPPPTERPRRIQVHTNQPESMIAPYLTSLQARLRSRGIRIGSYPDLERGVFVSLIGHDGPGNVLNTEETSVPLTLLQIAQEVEQTLGGRIVSDEEVARRKANARVSQNV